MSSSFFARVAATMVVAIAIAAAAAGQDLTPSTTAPSATAPAVTPPGWVVTPSLTYSTSWDDNVLIRGLGDNVTGDYLNVLNPRLSVDLNGRRTQMDTTYDGAFLLYRQFNTLDSFDQHASFSVRRVINPRLSLFASDSAAMLPTTEYVEFIGVPFLRTGSDLNDTRGGVEFKPSKFSSLTAIYNFQWVKFDMSPLYATELLGGHSHGGSLSWRQGISSHTTVTADSDLQMATVGNHAETFEVEHVSAGLEQRLSATTSIYGAAGISHVGVSSFGPAQSGPAVRAGLTHSIGTAGIDAMFSRSFVPSYGFGGTFQNQDFTVRLRLPIARRIYTTSSVSWRSDEPLVLNQLPLDSLWIVATVGYQWQPWLRLEGFYNKTHQTIGQPGGVMDRNIIGVQFITSNPLRVR